MELLTEATTLKGLLILIIGGLIYALRVTRGDLSKSMDEGYKNIEFFKRYISENIKKK